MERIGWNDGLRFVLELVALYGLGVGGWAGASGGWRLVAAVGLPLVAAVAWGTFRVPDDPGPAPVAVSGKVRLVLEAVVLGGGAVGLWAAHGAGPALVYAAATVFHYVMAGRRLQRILAFSGK